MADYIGQQLGNYRLIRLLGRGGFASVYLGKHIHLETHAAIKMLHFQIEDSDLERFRSEAKTIAHLVHPHIVRVLDFGVENNTPYLVMDYASNGTVRQHYPMGSCLPLNIIVDYVKQVAQALQYAHERRLIHRDVKPENMLLGPNNEILLSDFGISAIEQNTSSIVTQENAGTAPYMAPEQINGKPRPASDQYALGIVVYEWLCGTRPYQGTSLAVIYQHVSKAPPPLHEKVPAISPEVENVVLKALAKEPQQRFVSVQAFAEALEQASLAAQHASVPLQALPSPPAEQFAQTSPLVQQSGSPSMQTIPVPDISSNRNVKSSSYAEMGFDLPHSRTQTPIPESIVKSNSHRKGLSRSKMVLLIGLVCMIVAGSAGLLFFSLNRLNANTGTSVSTLYSKATATANSIALVTVTAAIEAYNNATASGTMFGFDAQHTHFNSYERKLNPTNVSGLVQDWAASTGNNIDSSPAVVNDVVYVGSDDGKFYAFDAPGCEARSCDPIWTASTGSYVDSSPAVANGVVYVGSEDGKLYAFHAPGCGKISCSPIWTASTGNSIYSSPTIAGGIVYIGSEDGKLYAFKSTGCGQASCSPLWTASTGDSIFSSPAVDNGVVYVGSNDHRLYAFNASGCVQASCSPLWTASTGNGILSSSLGDTFQASSSPAVANGIIYIGSEDGKLYAFKSTGCGQASCSPLWTAPTAGSILSSPAVADGVVYAGSLDGKLYAFDSRTGASLWASSTGNASGSSSPMVANGVVYIGSHNGIVYAFNASGCGKASCSPLWSFIIGNTIVSSPIVANGLLYIGSGDHNLYAFHLSNASP